MDAERLHARPPRELERGGAHLLRIRDDVPGLAARDERSPGQVAGMLAVLRSLYRLGLFGRERFEYWKLLIWTARRRPRLLGDAISLAIVGHHYRKVSERVLARQQAPG